MSVTFSAYQPATGQFSPDDLSINMNNRNAVFVAEALGVDLVADDWCGGTTGADFQGRVLMALALSPADEGVPSYEHSRAPGQARMIEGARPAGYMQERLEQLRELADWAVANDAEVTWG